MENFIVTVMLLFLAMTLTVIALYLTISVLHVLWSLRGALSHKEYTSNTQLNDIHRVTS